MLAILASIMVLDGVVFDAPLLLGVIAVAIAAAFGAISLWQGTKLEGLTSAISKQTTAISTLTIDLRNNQIEEKIAMIHSYAAGVNNWKRAGLDIEEQTKKVISDLRGLSEVGGEEFRKHPERAKDALGGLFENMEKDDDLKTKADKIKAEATSLGFY